VSLVNRAIIRGERATQSIRPASLSYAGDTILCTPGNLNFFEQLKPDGGGFQDQQNLHVKILRKDITAKMLAVQPSPFFAGQYVVVTNLDTESPGYGEQFSLIIGKNNVWQAMMVQINLTSQQA